MRHFAVVGAGPAGCYAAEHILRSEAAARVALFERLPTPFGLIRSGVAADHQSTKAVSRVLERVLANPRLDFVGNVEIGRDLALEAIEAAFDAVVLATGAPRDRRLGVPGESLAGVVPSGAFSAWCNGHPDHAAAAPALAAARSVAIIGNGNVALDMARLLAKAKGDLTASDLDPAVQAQLASAAVEEIHIVGRRGAGETRFSPHELSELVTLPGLGVALHDAEGVGPVPEILAAAARAGEAGLRLHFHFDRRPIGFRGAGRLEAAGFQPGGGDGTAPCWLPCRLAVTCIGYEAVACDRLTPADGVLPNLDGSIDRHLAVVGWAKRGASGTIATNRAEAQAVVKRLIDGLPAAKGAAGLAGLDLDGLAVVDHAAWQRIDAAERARGAGRPRRKFTSVAELLAAAAPG